MSKFKLLGILGLVIMMSGCFGGSVRETKSSFTADGGTFNFIGMRINLGANGFDANACPMKIAESHIPKGAKVTNVSATPTWRTMTFPTVILGLWNEYVIGSTYVQIGGTK